MSKESKMQDRQQQIITDRRILKGNITDMRNEKIRAVRMSLINLQEMTNGFISFSVSQVQKTSDCKSYIQNINEFLQDMYKEIHMLLSLLEMLVKLGVMTEDEYQTAQRWWNNVKSSADDFLVQAKEIVGIVQRLPLGTEEAARQKNKTDSLVYVTAGTMNGVISEEKQFYDRLESFEFDTELCRKTLIRINRSDGLSNSDSGGGSPLYGMYKTHPMFFLSVLILSWLTFVFLMIYMKNADVLSMPKALWETYRGNYIIFDFKFFNGHDVLEDELKAVEHSCFPLLFGGLPIGLLHLFCIPIFRMPFKLLKLTLFVPWYYVFIPLFNLILGPFLICLSLSMVYIIFAAYAAGLIGWIFMLIDPVVIIIMKIRQKKLKNEIS